MKHLTEMTFFLMPKFYAHNEFLEWNYTQYINTCYKVAYCNFLSQIYSQLSYHMVQNFDGGNIDGLASFRSLTGKILTDSLLENLYLLYN